MTINNKSFILTSIFLGAALTVVITNCKPAPLPNDSITAGADAANEADAINGADAAFATDGSAQGAGSISAAYKSFCRYTQYRYREDIDGWKNYLTQHQSNYCQLFEGFGDQKYEPMANPFYQEQFTNSCCLKECPSGFDNVLGSKCYKGTVNLNESRYRISKGVQTIDRCVGGSIDLRQVDRDYDFAIKAASGIFEQHKKSCLEILAR